MMSGAMRRTKLIVVLAMACAVALLTSACGTERISVPKQASQAAGGELYHGAVLFSQRCAGCHTLSYAGTHGSAPNIRTAQAISGPNFDIRCERPIDRVLYAIENGGFSGAYMPQNIVVGEDAIDVAKFVSEYAGRAAPKVIGLVGVCQGKPIGMLPAGTGQRAAATSASSSAAASAVKLGKAKKVPVSAHRAKKSARS